MNYSRIRNLIGKILILLSLLMVAPLIVSLCYQEGWKNAYSFLIPIATSGIVGFLFAGIKKSEDKHFGARDGLVIVGLSWILMSLFGSLPFLISGEIKNFFTAFFEIVSGFTTTGASALTQAELEGMSQSMLFWRSFSHWIGGMGILVFILAIVPESKEGSAVHILRAESAGPQVGKLVSKMQVTSRILYIIYISLTALEVIVLLILPDDSFGLFEALVYSFGTAGTGGFATTVESIGAYAPCIQYAIAVFMILFGINFTLFYFLLIKNFKDVYKNEELKFYFLIVIVATGLITWNLYTTAKYAFTFEESFRYAFFTVASVISTTGYSNIDFGSWPALSTSIILVLMIFGSCAGSTAGGMKLSRILIIAKYSKSKIRNTISPRKVEVVRLDGKPLESRVIDSTVAYVIIYFIVLFVCMILISIYNPKLPNLDAYSTFTASLACISNIGPGLGTIVGPSGGFADFSNFSKVVMSIEMIAGRLELFPILVLFSRNTWKKRI